jgi:hypothetical protein
MGNWAGAALGLPRSLSRCDFVRPSKPKVFAFAFLPCDCADEPSWSPEDDNDSSEREGSGRFCCEEDSAYGDSVRRTHVSMARGSLATRSACLGNEDGCLGFSYLGSCRRLFGRRLEGQSAVACLAQFEPEAVAGFRHGSLC